MGLLDKLWRRGASAEVQATLLAIDDLLRSDSGSPRDEPRGQDPRYLAAARTLSAALEGLSEQQRKQPMLGGRLWNTLGNTLARQWPECADEALRARECA